ncbi:hypothetical protein [Nocardioides sp.]|uniref:hypothetical protein n=1 Tax=Nocardioides sp. TaxID=35761 RepID=UPI002B276E4A|nr:hypothetical protein [Nocardioides sp.]
MLLTNIVLFVVIGLTVLGSCAYIAHRVRSAGREARAREERRAAALLAEIGAAHVATGAARVGTGSATQDPAPQMTSTDRLAADLESFFVLGGATPTTASPAVAGPTTPAVTASAHDLAIRLRLAADRIDVLASSPGTPATELADAVVAVAAEAASPAALLPVITAARTTDAEMGKKPPHDVC